nr:hypothetical protein [uncultured Mediterranean phage uvMED]
MRYSVFVGGVEANSFLLTYEEAVFLALDFTNNGYDDVQVMEVN